MAPFPKYSFKNVTGSINPVVVQSGRGTLHTITINATTASGIAVYDGVGTLGATKIAQIGASPAIGSTFRYDAEFSKGLTVVLGSGSSDLTVSTG